MDRIRFEGAGQQLPVDLQVSSAVQSLYVENTDGDTDISVPLSSYDLEISTVNGQTTSDFQDREGAPKTITVVTENGDITIHQSD